MKTKQEILMNNSEYVENFHMYFHHVGRNKRYANIFKKKMEKIEKELSK